MSKKYFRFTVILVVLVNLLFDYNIYIYVFNIAIFAFLLFAKVNYYTKILVLFYFIYYLFSMIPISTYRGTISGEMNMIFITFISLHWLVSTLEVKIKNKQEFLVNKRYFYIISFIHVMIAYIVVIYIYSRYGFIIINQEKRVLIPTIYEYIVKSLLILPVFYAPRKLILNTKFTMVLVVTSLLPTLLIGHRGSVFIAISAYVLVYYSTHKNVIYNFHFKKKYLAIIGGIFITILYLGFYIRRYNTSYMSPSELIVTYFSHNNIFIQMILPLHLSLKENIGIANTILNRDIINTLTPYPAMVADFFTILPGEQISGGKIIGSYIGTQLNGGLTPSILGGILIDFDILELFIISFFIFVTLQIIYIYSKQNIRILILFSWIFLNYLHFFHRGLLKPEYLMTTLIIVFYLIFTKKVTVYEEY
jgi:hypothetical protein